VANPQNLSLELIMAHVKCFNHQTPESLPWIMSPQMNVLIPCAGAGSRFQQVGYRNIKPLIDVCGKFMIEWVIENLNIAARHIFLCQQRHVEQNRLDLILPILTRSSGQLPQIVTVPGLTDGAARTTLYAKELINNANPLIIANSDQYVLWNSHAFLYKMQSENIDAGILTFDVPENDPKWSFVCLNENGYVVEVQEKKQISNKATVGIYYWRHGSDYVKYAEQMIAKDIRTNNEFYVCPVYNEAIQDGKKVIIFDAERMIPLGTPTDLECSKKYLQEHIIGPN
jgi:dTDP-glucose pyrophosphorylase